MRTKDGKRIAKNALYMYVRMIILTIISLYTSRVILQQLGVEDFGIYNLVGSIVALFHSLRGLFATSTQRFLNYEIGRGNFNRLQTVFNMSIYINGIISLIFILSVELVGYWFFKEKINISPDRFNAAVIVFQCSIFTAITSIMTTPYDAVVVAHEKMGFYAYMSIFEGVARLGLVLILSLCSVDKLILYSFLQLFLALLVRFINSRYCAYNFPESHIKKCWDKQLFKDMTKFAGWNFFGNTSFALSQSGLNMILNTFGGPIVNAARGISYQIKNCVDQLTNNLIMVIKPYYIKTYAEGNMVIADKIMYLSGKILFSVQLCVVIVMVFLTQYILEFWLGQVPDYSIIFIQLVFLNTLIRSLHPSVNLLFMAVGNLKIYQICEGVLLALPIAMSYLMLNFGFEYYWVFISVIIFELINYTCIIFIARKICNLNVKEYFRNLLLPCITCGSIAIPAFILNNYISSLLLKIALIVPTILIIVGIMYKLGLEEVEKKLIVSIIKKRK